MNISEFINLNPGEWFSQRTNYALDRQTADNSKANLTIELLEKNHPEITKLCQENNLENSSVVCGLKTSWDNSVDWGKSKQQGSALIVLIADSQNQERGKIIQLEPGVHRVNSGEYVLAPDEALTLTIKTEQIEAQERLWFASENLRLRTIMVKDLKGRMQTSFYSEIRKMARKTESVPTNATTNV